MTHKEIYDIIMDKYMDLSYGINARSIVWNLIIDEEQKECACIGDTRDIDHLAFDYAPLRDTLMIRLMDKYGNTIIPFNMSGDEIDEFYNKLLTFKLVSKEDAIKEWTLYKYNVNYCDVAYLNGMFLTTKEFIDKFKECISNADEQVYLGEVVGDNSDFEDEYFFDELEEITSDQAEIQFFIDNIAKDLSFGFVPFEHIKNISCEKLEFETPRYIQ